MRMQNALLFPKYDNVVERKKTIVNRLQRATERGKFSRAAYWEFDVVLNARQYTGNPKAKN